jgi:hypothetical protein
MKRSLLLLTGTAIMACLFSCQKTFLQKPSTTGTSTSETVFSTAVNAQAALAAAYRGSLLQGLPYSGLGHGNLSGISGEHSRGYNWHATWFINSTGMSPNPGEGGNPATSSDNFSDDYTQIRRACLVRENIDKVKDMDGATKAAIKAEMAGLLAYRYMGMFIRYGGVPIVTNAQEPTDSLAVPRASLSNTLSAILSLCDTAVLGLPDKWTDGFAGRLTRGAALAIRARTLMFAARPLFNSASPYLNLTGHNDLISFGSADANRWNDAIAANEAVITWATANGYGLINTGGAAPGIPDPNAFDDYGAATSTPNNKEVLLAYKVDEVGNGIPKWFNLSIYYNNVGAGDRYDTDLVGLLTNFLTNYYQADGTDQSWPQPGDAARPASDYQTRLQQMEPRFLADHFAPGLNAKNNPGDNGWSAGGSGSGGSGRGINQNGGYGKGDAQSSKFYYHAGSRIWFEFPLFRMAECYLNLAEAYNETGNSVKALQNLNLIHNRAGLPAITVTDPAQLRVIIRREWAVEYYNENQRYFTVKHWRLPDIGNGIMGGAIHEFQFTLIAGASDGNVASNLATYYDQVVYQAYWNDKMFLEPFPQSEINKGIIVQNPGY